MPVQKALTVILGKMNHTPFSPKELYFLVDCTGSVSLLPAYFSRRAAEGQVVRSDGAIRQPHAANHAPAVTSDGSNIAASIIAGREPISPMTTSPVSNLLRAAYGVLECSHTGDEFILCLVGSFWLMSCLGTLSSLIMTILVLTSHDLFQMYDNPFLRSSEMARRYGDLRALCFTKRTRLCCRLEEWWPHGTRR
jgi:hypothetical protein